MDEKRQVSTLFAFQLPTLKVNRVFFFGAKVFRPRLCCGEFDFIVEYDIRDVTHHAHDL